MDFTFCVICSSALIHSILSVFSLVDLLLHLYHIFYLILFFCHFLWILACTQCSASLSVLPWLAPELPSARRSAVARVVYVIIILGMTACLVLNDLYRSTLRNTCNGSTYDYQTMDAGRVCNVDMSRCIDKNKKARIYTVGRERVFVCVRDSAGCMNGWAL